MKQRRLQRITWSSSQFCGNPLLFCEVILVRALWMPQYGRIAVSPAAIQVSSSDPNPLFPITTRWRIKNHEANNKNIGVFSTRVVATAAARADVAPPSEISPLIGTTHWTWCMCNIWHPSCARPDYEQGMVAKTGTLWFVYVTSAFPQKVFVERARLAISCDISPSPPCGELIAFSKQWVMS